VAALAIGFSVTASADPIIGTVVFDYEVMQDLLELDTHLNGSPLFGYLPHGAVSETASASAQIEFEHFGQADTSMDIPTPVYADGDVAETDEIFFVVEVATYRTGPDPA